MSIIIDRQTLEWDRKTRKGNINVTIQGQMRRLECSVDGDGSIVILNGIRGRYKHGEQLWAARVSLALNDRITAMLGRHIRGSRFELLFEAAETPPVTTNIAPELT